MKRFQYTSGFLGALVSIGLIAVRASSPAHANLTHGERSIAEASRVESVQLQGLDGRTHSLREYQSGHILVVVFLGKQCPVSNYYLPALNRIQRDYSSRGVRVIGVDVDPAVATAVRPHFRVSFPVLLDPELKLASVLGARTTSEVFLIDRMGRVRYRGRIDDSYFNRLQRKPKPLHQDLRLALNAVAAGKPVARPFTEAFGCLIEPVPQVSRESKSGGVTFAHDIAPILNANCANCHHPGEVAPFSLLTYQDARRWANDLADLTSRHLMPPWKPVDEHDEFVSERHLNEDQIKLIARWAAAGAPAGDLKKAPPTPTFTSGWKLGKPDVILTPSEPYHLAADGPDVYRCFVLHTSLPEDTYVSAVEYQPSNRKVVHHCIGYLDTGGNGQRLDEQDPGIGYTHFGGPGFIPAGEMGGWAPGNDPLFLPDGIGRLLPHGADLVLQIHYHKDGKPEVDQTRVGLYLAKKPVQQRLRTMMVIYPWLNIPAGDKKYAAEASKVVPADSHLISVTPHMHLLGRTVRMDAQFPDGTVRNLVTINDWDFNWQGTYLFRRPIAVPKGTRITLHASYDNSDANPRNPNHPPQAVHWGENTTDEMCIGFVGYVRDDGSQPAAGGGLLRRLLGRL